MTSPPERRERTTYLGWQPIIGRLEPFGYLSAPCDGGFTKQIARNSDRVIGESSKRSFPILASYHLVSVALAEVNALSTATMALNGEESNRDQNHDDDLH
jgi:hypothetical protein